MPEMQEDSDPFGLTIQPHVDVYQPIETTYSVARVACELAKPGDRILEVGTGSGLIAIAVAKRVPGAEVVASDINEIALEVAQANARENQASIHFVRSDMFASFEGREFDMIISHPPAVPYLVGATWEMSEGMTTATRGGIDGSDLVCRTIREARPHIRRAGMLVLGLPHWSNVSRALAMLESLYSYEVKERVLAKFFPMAMGSPSPDLIAHVRKLAYEGVIDIDFDEEPPVAPVSVVVARPRK